MQPPVLFEIPIAFGGVITLVQVVVFVHEFPEFDLKVPQFFGWRRHVFPAFYFLLLPVLLATMLVRALILSVKDQLAPFRLSECSVRLVFEGVLLSVA